MVARGVVRKLGNGAGTRWALERPNSEARIERRWKSIGIWIPSASIVASRGINLAGIGGCGRVFNALEPALSHEMELWDSNNLWCKWEPVDKNFAISRNTLLTRISRIDSVAVRRIGGRGSLLLPNQVCERRA